MRVQDYLQYSAKITPDGEFFMVEIDGAGWEGALSQGRTMDEAHEMAREVILDYIDGLVEFKKRIPVPEVMTEDRYIVNFGYDTALKIVIRNLMYDQQVKPAELARRLRVSNQNLNSILNLRKTTNINRLAECLQALGASLEVEVKDE